MMTEIGALDSLLARYSHKQITHGMSGAAVYHLPEVSAYLKIATHQGSSSLGYERSALEWLCGKLPVPVVLGYKVTDSCEYLLTSAIHGIVGSDHLADTSSTADSALAFVTKAAGALRRMHDLAIDDCDLDQRIDVKLARARENIQIGLLSETNESFAARHNGRFPMDLYRDLLERRPKDVDLVFTHGDPCAPNIILDGDEIAGFIDLDGAGVADRYTDISIFFGSFRRNCRVEVDFIPVFCEAYGIEELDADKLEFYALLDDLF